jgi:hypothetical protein
MVLVVLVALRPARCRAKRQAAEFPKTLRSRYRFPPLGPNSSQRDKFHPP